MAYRIGPTVVVALTMLAGCESPIDPPPPVPDVRDWVTGAAAASLDGNGHFLLPAATAPGSRPITSAVLAVSLSREFLRFFTAPPSLIPGELQRQRGASIDFDDVVPADRIYYARSPYSPIPDNLPVYLRKYLGPFFLVPFLEDGAPVLVIVSSAYNTDIGIESDHLVFPPEYGHDFSWVGLPVGTGYGMPVTPEHAVEVVWKATRTRVRGVPELLAPDRLFSPLFARWRVVLEHPVRVLGGQTGKEYQASELYVRGEVLYGAGRPGPPRDLLEVALPEQPAADTVRYTRLEAREERQTLVVGISPEVPVRFEPAEVRP